MVSLRTFASLGLLAVAVTSVGCKKDDPPKAAPEPHASAVATAALPARGKLNVRQPMAVPRIDPQVMKEYRVDVCYFGTLSLREARDAYLASLGTAEPGPGKIPSFGAAAAPPAPPGGSASAGAPHAPTPPVAGSASAAPAGSVGIGALRGPRPPSDFLPRPPHERNARACSVARGLKEPAMPEVDAAVAAFSDFAIELSKDIANATAYYARKDYEGDKFAKGKELHKKLKDGFAKYDELSEKLGAAVAAWRKEHPADLTKMEEGQKEAIVAFEDARVAMLAVATKKADAAAFKAATEKLGKSVEPLKARAAKENPDTWAKVVAPAAEDFLKLATELAPKVEKGLDPEQHVKLVTSFVNLVEAKQRALSRTMMAKAQAEQAAAAASGAPAAGSAAPAAGSAAPAPH
jgi:hypothetical protein